MSFERREGKNVKLTSHFAYLYVSQCLGVLMMNKYDGEYISRQTYKNYAPIFTQSLFRGK